MKIKFHKLILAVLTVFLLPSVTQAQSEIPVVNSKVIDFCTKSMGKKIDSGECWDLAKFALDYANAKWEAPFDYGNVVSPNDDVIVPGDIIQFEKVKLSNGTTYPHHTAIVYKVLGQKKYLIVHQNFNKVRKVSTRELDLSLLSKGTIAFYRPR